MPDGMKEKEMIDLLLKRFIKDYDKTKNPEVRTRYGVFAGIVGIISNLILFLAKILAGVLTASVSIMADAVNNLSDAGSSIVTLIGFKLAGKPADYEHPYGHGRIEYISGFIVSGAIIIMGFELLTTSFRKILHPTPLEVSIPSLIILVLSILMKMWMAKFNKYLGNKVVCHNIPIRPGRNLAVICESAAINHRQKKMGYNAAQELYRRVQESLTRRRDEDEDE